MSCLAELPELVGFFSYSREDDEDSHGALSALRERIQRELRGQLGRTRRTFRLWQDKEAIAPGKLWEAEIKGAAAQSVFFIPIITPTVVRSKYCRFELESFLAREAELGRSDLVFPILYIKVPELEDSARQQNDAVLSIIAKRQYLDWREFRHKDVNSPEIMAAIERFCAHICDALHRSSSLPDAGYPPERGVALQYQEANSQNTADSQIRERANEELREPEPDARIRDQTNAKQQVEHERHLLPSPEAPLSRRAAIIGSLIAAVIVGTVSMWLARAPRTPVAPVSSAPNPIVPAPAPVTSAPVAPAPAPVTSAPLSVEPPATPVPPTPVPEAPTQIIVAPLSPERERVLSPKDTFKECSKCPEMIVVPAGSFKMGSPANEPSRFDKEGPQHRVTFARQFAVGRFALTFEEWDACAADGGCNGYRPDDQGWGRGRQPVINVSRNDAAAYIVWLSNKIGKQYHLLSEAEREYVTRAGTTSPFWWGNSISTSQANYNGNYTYGNGMGIFRARTLPVDSFVPNPWGLYQVHGNTWDTTEDCWHDNYEGAPSDGSAWTSGDCSQRILKGGGFDNSPEYLRSAQRGGNATESRVLRRGFRVGRALLAR